MAQLTTIQLSKSPYILLPQNTCTHQHLLNSSTEHTSQTQATSHGWSVYLSLCIARFSFTAEWTGAHFGYKSCPGTLGTEDCANGGTRTTISCLRVQCLNRSATSPPYFSVTMIGKVISELKIGSRLRRFLENFLHDSLFVFARRRPVTLVAVAVLWTTDRGTRARFSSAKAESDLIIPTNFPYEGLRQSAQAKT